MVGKPDRMERCWQRWIANPRLDSRAMSRCKIEIVAQQMGSEEWLVGVDETKLSDHLAGVA
jgi:hypothetical protein